MANTEAERRQPLSNKERPVSHQHEPLTLTLDNQEEC